MKILVIEDERTMAGLVVALLAQQGDVADVCVTGEEGLRRARAGDYDGVVLDLGLPDRSGLSVLRELRSAGSKVPILILTGRTATSDLVRGLDAGADDYLVKPFENAELVARLRALVRRGGMSRVEQLTCGPLLIDRIAHRVLVSNRELHLTPREFRLLEHLALRADQVITRPFLLAKIWNMHFDPGTNMVDALVLRVRRKLERVGPSPRVVTVRGQGYMLTDSPAVANDARSIAS